MVSCQKNQGVERLTLRVGSAVLLQGNLGEIGVDGIGPQGINGFAKATESEVGESTNPAEVGFLGRGLVSAGAAEPSHVFKENGHGFILAGDGSAITPSQLLTGEAGMTDGDRVAQTRGMVLFKNRRPIGDGFPVEIRRPIGHLDAATPKLHGKERLPELPVFEAGGAPDFLEEAKGCLL